MKTENIAKIQTLIEVVNRKNQGIDLIAQIDQNRAYGGIIRAAKGKLIEELCKEIVRIAWSELDGRPNDLGFSDTTVPIPLKEDYLARITSPVVKDWIISNRNKFVFRAQVDVHVMIRNQFVLGIECKAYTENAMLKRILVDYTLLKTVYPSLKCGLLQLES